MGPVGNNKILWFTATSNKLLFLIDYRGRVYKTIWEVENRDFRSPPLSMEEQAVVKHFNTNYSRDHAGWFNVPLPIKAKTDPLGEFRSIAV